MQILEGENGRFCQKRLKMIKNDERPEYNFWKLTKVGTMRIMAVNIPPKGTTV